MGRCLIWKVTLFIVAILFVSGCVQHSRLLEKHEEQRNSPGKPGFLPSLSKPVPKKYMEYRNFPGAERFGFVCMDLLAIQDLNLGWVRPHPGPFIWGKIEPAKGKYDFSQVDEVVRKAQAMNLTSLQPSGHMQNGIRKSGERIC